MLYSSNMSDIFVPPYILLLSNIIEILGVIIGFVCIIYMFYFLIYLIYTILKNKKLPKLKSKLVLFVLCIVYILIGGLSSILSPIISLLF